VEFSEIDCHTSLLRWWRSNKGGKVDPSRLIRDPLRMEETEADLKEEEDRSSRGGE